MSGNRQARTMASKIKVKKLWFSKPTSETSKRMKLVRSSGTSIEKAMEVLLRERNVRFERRYVLLGKPDFVLEKQRIAVFCDSSFWHGRRAKEISGETFKKNKAFWVHKLETNKKRDAKISGVLRRQGWSVLRFWDTDILKNPLKVKNKLIRALVKK